MEKDQRKPWAAFWFYQIYESVCVNGAIYWLTQYVDFIVAFDLKDEKFRLIPVPRKYKDENSKPLTPFTSSTVNFFFFFFGWKGINGIKPNKTSHTEKPAKQGRNQQITTDQLAEKKLQKQA